MNTRLYNLWLSDIKPRDDGQVNLLFNEEHGFFHAPDVQSAYATLIHFNNNPNSPYCVQLLEKPIHDRFHNKYLVLYKKDASPVNPRSDSVAKPEIPIHIKIEIANHLHNTGAFSVVRYITHSLRDELFHYKWNRLSTNDFVQATLSLFQSLTSSHFSTKHKLAAGHILNDFLMEFNKNLAFTRECISEIATSAEQSKTLTTVESNYSSFLTSLSESASLTDYLFKHFVTLHVAITDPYDNIIHHPDRKILFNESKILSETLEDGQLGKIYGACKLFISNYFRHANELEKNTRVLGQAKRDSNHLFSTLPNEIIHKILLLTSDRHKQDPDTIITSHLNKPSIKKQGIS